MDDIYLIEIRLGRTKWRIRKTVFTIARMFNIESNIERNPHVTLFGPLALNVGVTSVEFLDAIGRVAAECDPIPFTIDGWEKREGMSGSVIAFRVRPSEKLKNLTASIAGAVSPLVCSSNIWDTVPDSKWFHVTVANHLDPTVASSVFSTLKKCTVEEPAEDRSSPGFAAGSCAVYSAPFEGGKRMSPSRSPSTKQDSGSP